MGIAAILGVAFVALALFVIMVYNTLVRLRMGVRGAWSDVEVQLKRRYDLIPNLVETVKGYATHEKDTLKQVMEARSQATSMNIDISKVTPDMMAQFSQMQSGISGALGRLMAVAEAYPDLKASENFLNLQSELTVIEDAIQGARRYFNASVGDYNIRIETVPSNIIAKLFSFVQFDFFDIPEEEAVVPEVKF